jgi:hypothetical protein
LCLNPERLDQDEVRNRQEEHDQQRARSRAANSAR